jgi:NAD(P)-dependent dehydrogenase (short-subunit alcohol dehydrogenase family)
MHDHYAWIEWAGRVVCTTASTKMSAQKGRCEMERVKSNRTANLQNKRVVILGGSSGIGLAVAEAAAAMEADVVIASSNPERVRKAIATIGERAQGQALDLSDEQEIRRFFEKLGDFDHLVFTAGDTLQLNELAATDLQKARETFELRYWAAVAAVKYASPNLRKGGSIVLTTGSAGRRPQKGWVFAASLCGSIEALTRALAVELAPIRVNAVCPGVVRTNLWQNMSEPAREEFYRTVGQQMLVGRVGEVEDIAQAYLYLLQEGYSTGQTVVVDGGSILV